MQRIRARRLCWTPPEWGSTGSSCRVLHLQAAPTSGACGLKRSANLSGPFRAVKPVGLRSRMPHRSAFPASAAEGQPNTRRRRCQPTRSRFRVTRRRPARSASCPGARERYRSCSRRSRRHPVVDRVSPPVDRELPRVEAPGGRRCGTWPGRRPSRGRRRSSSAVMSVGGQRRRPAARRPASRRPAGRRPSGSPPKSTAEAAAAASASPAPCTSVVTS